MAKQQPQQKPPEPEPGSSEGNLLVQTIRHRNLKAAIWKNETDKGVIYNVTLTRSYRVEDQWHDSQSFSYSDLMNVVKLLFDTHTFITEVRLKEASSERRPAPAPTRAGKP